MNVDYLAAFSPYISGAAALGLVIGLAAVLTRGRG